MPDRIDHDNRLRASAAAVVAALAVLVGGAGAAAECTDPPPSRNAATYVGYAFTATVRLISEVSLPPARPFAPFDWRVELDVRRVYRGSMGDRLVVNGWEVGCSSFYGRHLRVGDELFISVDRLDLDRNPSLYGDVLVWRRTQHGWSFYERALRYGGDERSYPPAARSATSITGILNLVGPDALPDTATAAPDASSRGTEPAAPTRLVVFLGVLVAALRWRLAFRARRT